MSQSNFLTFVVVAWKNYYPIHLTGPQTHSQLSIYLDYSVSILLYIPLFFLFLAVTSFANFLLFIAVTSFTNCWVIVQCLQILCLHNSRRKLAWRPWELTMRKLKNLQRYSSKTFQLFFFILPSYFPFIFFLSSPSILGHCDRLQCWPISPLVE